MKNKKQRHKNKFLIWFNNSKTSIVRGIGFSFLIAAFIGFFFASELFFTGFHNVDLVFNYQNQALAINPILNSVNVSLPGVDNATDSMLNNQPMTLSDVYRNGVIQELTGFKIVFASGIIFTFGVLMIWKKKTINT